MHNMTLQSTNTKHIKFCKNQRVHCIISLQHAQTEISDWLEEVLVLKVVSNCATITTGVLCVMMDGVTVMLVWFVGSLDMQALVNQ